jgi:hypothetical protein
VSSTSDDVRCSHFAYHTLDCRTVGQIQWNVVKTDKQNTISRIFHAKDNKATIAAWRSDLDRILHVFEVCMTVSSLPTTLTTARFQTELALHNYVALSDVRYDVANTRELVSDIHHTMMIGREGMETVRNRCAIFFVEGP